MGVGEAEGFGVKRFPVDGWRFSVWMSLIDSSHQIGFTAVLWD